MANNVDANKVLHRHFQAVNFLRRPKGWLRKRFLFKKSDVAFACHFSMSVSLAKRAKAIVLGNADQTLGG
jgi:hypothetical protein